MFTGLVQDIGVIRDIDTSRECMRIEVATNTSVTSVQVGASISCSGCCLTVVGKTKNSLFFDVSTESLSKCIIGSWRVKTRVNLEPSLQVGDEMGGHFVSGHVDATTKIIGITDEGGSKRLEIVIPTLLKKFIAVKGSITIDGISLTVNGVGDTSFDVNIIPHTWDNTTLCDREIGDDVNIEIDLLARYAAKIIETIDLGDAA